MNKFLKVVGIIFLILLLLLVSLVAYLYFSNRWIINAEDMSGIIFGSNLFNEKLKNCTPSFSHRGSYFNEPWEIQGLKKDKCLIYYYEGKDLDYETGTYTEIIHKCSLPKEIYSYADNINWSSILNNTEYCYW